MSLPSLNGSSGSSAAAVNNRSPVKSGRESGYALLFALFLVATIILFAAAATPSLLTQARREKEQETIWRANQYVRAIRLYYRKNGRYPQTLEDLTKADNVGNHYLRKAYTDPTNLADGSWRVIYVTPSGQLVGSIHYHSLQEMAAALMPGMQPPVPGAGAATANAFAQQAAQQPGQQGAGQQGALSNAAGQQPGQAQAATPGSQPGQDSTQGAQGGFGGTPAANQGSSQASSQGFGQGSTSGGFGSAQPASLTPLEAVDSPVMGGFAIGVASKVKQPSLLVYHGGKTYFDWEFIFNPLLDPSVGGQATGASAPIVPAGSVPGNGTAQPVNPAAPGQNGATPSYPQGSQNPFLSPAGGSPTAPTTPPETPAPSPGP